MTRIGRGDLEDASGVAARSLHGRRVLVTGAASGLGAALAREARERGADALHLLDHDLDGLSRVAAETGGMAIEVDLTDRCAVDAALATVLEDGVPDIAIANAGAIVRSGLDATDDLWDFAWRLHVLSNVWIFSALMPHMLSRGSGHLACTASSAALAPNPKSVVYSVTKHAQLALAEWTACAAAAAGLGFTCFCPGGMRTAMLQGMSGEDEYSRRASAEAHTPDAAAAVFLDGIARGQFLVTTQARALAAMRERAADPQSWVAAQAEQFLPGGGPAGPGGR